MGFHRLSYPEKVCLMPDLLKCLNNQQLSHKWALMTLFVSVFGDASFEPQVKISPVKEPKSDFQADLTYLMEGFFKRTR